jgi:hypothetical protein
VFTYDTWGGHGVSVRWECSRLAQVAQAVGRSADSARLGGVRDIFLTTTNKEPTMYRSDLIYQTLKAEREREIADLLREREHRRAFRP